jgi:hypothetical protein
LAEHLAYRIACGDLVDKWLSAQVKIIQIKWKIKLIFLKYTLYKS